MPGLWFQQVSTCFNILAQKAGALWKWLNPVGSKKHCLEVAKYVDVSFHPNPVLQNGTQLERSSPYW